MTVEESKLATVVRIDTRAPAAIQFEARSQGGGIFVETRTGSSWRHWQGVRETKKLTSDLRPITPEHRVRREVSREQQARRVNHIANPGKSAKPPSPVQIRAAPPNFIADGPGFPVSVFITHPSRKYQPLRMAVLSIHRHSYGARSTGNGRRRPSKSTPDRMGVSRTMCSVCRRT